MTEVTTEELGPTAALIIEAALERFSEMGYDGTSMREIARAVGVKPASLYNHYASKEDILWAIVKEATRELARMQDAAEVDGADPATQLRTFVRTHVGYHANHGRNARIVNRQIYSLNPERYEEVTAFRDRYEGRLRRILRTGARQGVFSVPNARITSYAILQMGMGIANWFRPDGPVRVSELCDIHERLALRMVGMEQPG